MTNKQNPKFQELVAKLREIFQIDCPELDFGIYRILNARAGEINDYLQDRLAEKVRSAGRAASVQQLQAELAEAEKNAQTLGMDLDAVPKVRELRAKLKEAEAGSSEHENAVFTHLLTFFSRYYDNGDFISQRRYKGDTYAIPYAGEEVVLHWANKDQYYTKSGENFSNYSFKLDDGRSVHFRLVTADTAKDNRKDNAKERRFVLIGEHTRALTDDDGEEYEETLLPVTEENGANGPELVLRFEYKAMPKGSKQDALVLEAVNKVLADAAVKARWLELGRREPTEKNPQRTLLEKHLTRYTSRNTADYFIHKDLGGFLRRELDFYIKNEVMHLDDVQNAERFSDIEKNLRMIQCLRAIGLDLITFLAQLEDFQKKLWLKKKFVVATYYCITLDRIFAIEDEKTRDWLIAEIIKNDAQREEWVRLFAINEIAGNQTTPGYTEPLKPEFLKAHPTLVVDTRHFGEDFKRCLLAAIPDLDEETDGVLINSENFQALRLMQVRYREQVKCIYIDPPYNTGSDEFVYKDDYQHSSWLSMMYDRLTFGREWMREDGAIFVSIDDGEQDGLRKAMEVIFGDDNFINNIIWQKKFSPQNDAKWLSDNHDFLLLFAKRKRAWRPGLLPRTEAQDRRYQNPDNDPRGPWMSGDLSVKTYSRENDYPITTPSGRAVNPPKGYCWRYSRERLQELIADNRIWFGPDGNGVPRLKRFLSETKQGITPLTIWSYNEVGHNQEGKQELKGMLSVSDEVFGTPKPTRLLGRVITIGASGEDNALVLDFFAGSGTTGHAVINLNREDGGRRKFILVEMGDYFDTMLVPRLKKVIFTPEWKDGEPKRMATPEEAERSPRILKILHLESYEDTLNNLQLRRTEAQQSLLKRLPPSAKEDYLLHYLLDVESRGSLLSVQDFRKPFDYTLNVAVDSAGAYQARKIDLVETFNYLIGLRVKHIDMQPALGFVTVTGTLPSGESCLVLWRDCDVLDYEGVSKLCDTLGINPAGNEFDVVYINGDHNIPTVLTQTAEEGGATRVLKLRQIEPEFLGRMFSVEDI